MQDLTGEYYLKKTVTCRIQNGRKSGGERFLTDDEHTNFGTTKENHAPTCHYSDGTNAVADGNFEIRT